MAGDGRDAGASGWDAYWRHTREAAAHKDGGPQDQVLAQFWSTLFREFLARRPQARILDLACGNGAVTGHALATATHLDQPPPPIVGLDRSLPALTRWCQRFASGRGVVGDAARPPFADGSFQLIASQFGIEYAGPEAVLEAARLVAPEGAFAAVLHLAGGGIHRECRDNLQAIDEIRRSELLPRFAELFRAGAAARQGRGGKARLRRADERLGIALRVLKKTVATHGPGIAGGALARLQTDIDHMVQRRQAFEPTPVLAWAERMAGELAGYRERMAAMLTAAVDDDGMDAMTMQLASAGLQVRVRERLVIGSGGEAGAWALVCDRA